MDIIGIYCGFGRSDSYAQPIGWERHGKYIVRETEQGHLLANGPKNPDSIFERYSKATSIMVQSNL